MQQPYSFYGAPGGVPAASARPMCWGNGASFNLDTAVCRGCQFQNSCKDEVTRIRNSQPTTTYHSPNTGYVPPPPPAPAPQPWAPPALPVPSGYAYWPHASPAPAAPTAPKWGYPAPQPQPAPQPVPPAMNAQRLQQPASSVTPLFGYGTVPDPLFNVLGSVPPPFRPQVYGETFKERVMKNMFLAGVEAIAIQGLLAIRQMFLPPKSMLPTSESDDTTGR